MNNLSMKIILKSLIYYIAKLLGLFQLALKLTENEYKILCYHGGAIHDEHLFWPGVFISEKRFKQHLDVIRKYSFHVLPLSQAIEKASRHDLPKNTLIFTFDDGFFSTKKVIEPLLKKAGYPATLYVTTYYVMHQRPIFNVTLRYMLFRTKVKTFDLTFFNGEQHTFKTKDKDILRIIEYAKTIEENKQIQLLELISEQLQFDIDSLIQQRLFHNLNPEELREIQKNGIFDIQLHTHRHNLSNDIENIVYEIKKNRKILSETTGKDENTLIHFCYPSGIWNEQHIKILKKLGIVSATTMDPGINNTNSDKLKLKRINCSNNQPLILFEAEITGFNILISNKMNTLKDMKQNFYHWLKVKI